MSNPVSTLVAAVLSATAAHCQIPCWNPNVGTNLGLGDEAMSAGQALGFTFDYAGTGWTDIQVCDNGYVTLGATGGSPDYTPDSNTLISDPFPRICPFWVDLDPTAPGSGDVFFNAIPQNGGTPAHAIITWVGVHDFLGSTPHTFQLVLQDGGAIRCSYDAGLSLNAGPWLVGASPGNGVPANTVSFTSLPILTAGNPTLHEEDPVGLGCPLAGMTIDWTPDTSGGYIVSTVTGCATSQPYGTGCVGEFTSFYEWLPTTTSIDLGNSAIAMTLTGSSYVVTASSTSFVAPTAAAVNLNLTDDSETAVPLVLNSSQPFPSMPYPGGSTSALNVASNGHISTATNGAAFDYSPTPTEFLGWPATTWAVWHDFVPAPTGAGTVWFEVVGNLSIVTWDAVVSYHGTAPGTTPSTFQFQFDRATGDVAIVFLAMDTASVSTFAGGDGWVVGFTAAGPSIDPGNVDLSAVLGAGSLTTSPLDMAPLALTCDNPPVVGTTIQLVTSNITQNAVFAGLLFGFMRIYPGVNLTAFGMPDCYRYNNQLSVLLFFPQGAPTVQLPFAIPNLPGIQITVQSASYDPTALLTPLGAVTSNGLALRLGQ